MRLPRKDERSAFEVLSEAPPARKARRTLFMGKNAIWNEKVWQSRAEELHLLPA